MRLVDSVLFWGVEYDFLFCGGDGEVGRRKWCVHPVYCLNEWDLEKRRNHCDKLGQLCCLFLFSLFATV